MADDPNGGGQGTDPTQAFQSRLAKMNGDAMAFATVLFDENFQLRNKNRELEKQVPGDGAVVLNKADAARWKAFNDLGKKPEELTAVLDEHGKQAPEIARLKRKDVLRDVAATGYKLSVLEDLDSKEVDRDEQGNVKGYKLEYLVKDEKDKAGAERKVAYVKHEGKEIPLEQFASEKWGDYVPALKAEQGEQTPAKPGNGRSPAPSGGASQFDAVREREKKRQEAAKPGGSVLDRFLGRPATPAT